MGPSPSLQCQSAERQGRVITAGMEPAVGPAAGEQAPGIQTRTGLSPCSQRLSGSWGVQRGEQQGPTFQGTW